MARRKFKQSPEEDFPMTPMIDMVFLLLVFFMTVSTLAQAERAKEVDLPESAESDVPEASELSDRGTISVDAGGGLYLGTRPVSLEQMQAAMKTALSENPDLRIHLRADQDTPYGEIKKVLKACADVGAYEVIYATYQMR
ncbi:MAG: ExbD/TolR family protein [Opitutales bacterium]